MLVFLYWLWNGLFLWCITLCDHWSLWRVDLICAALQAWVWYRNSVGLSWPLDALWMYLFWEQNQREKDTCCVTVVNKKWKVQSYACAVYFCVRSHVHLHKLVSLGCENYWNTWMRKCACEWPVKMCILKVYMYKEISGYVQPVCTRARERERETAWVQ